MPAALPLSISTNVLVPVYWLFFVIAQANTTSQFYSGSVTYQKLKYNANHLKSITGQSLIELTSAY
jgi:hypothetical protein